MKNWCMLPVLLFALLVSSLWAGTAIKKSGTRDRNNYEYFVKWDFDTAGTFTRTGAAAGTNTDTLVLWQDSASSTPYYTSIWSTQGLNTGTPIAMPDSIKYCVLAHDDAADAITLRSEFQYKFRTTQSTWQTFGGNGDLALAGAGVPVWSCFSRQFLPGLPWRIVVHVTTTTDSATVNYVNAFPIRK